MIAPIAFLHIPKTAGQAIHQELVRLVGGPGHVSPIRVHTQAPQGPQMPPGYQLYSGHIDWVELDSLPADRFAFTVLRNPRERIASFYFYLLKEAEALDAAALERPENRGKKLVLQHSADDYFFGGEASWRNFILNHYDNFYCTYFATRKMNGRSEIAQLLVEEQIARAKAGLAQLQGVYSTEALGQLEDDIEARFGTRISVAGRYYNTGGHARDEARWPKLMARLERDSTRDRLDAFTRGDDILMRRIFPSA